MVPFRTECAGRCESSNAKQHTHGISSLSAFDVLAKIFTISCWTEYGSSSSWVEQGLGMELQSLHTLGRSAFQAAGQSQCIGAGGEVPRFEPTAQGKACAEIRFGT